MLNASQAGNNFHIIIDDFQDKPSEDSVMPEFEQEEHLGMSASKTSASSEIQHGSPAKGT